MRLPSISLVVTFLACGQITTEIGGNRKDAGSAGGSSTAGGRAGGDGQAGGAQTGGGQSGGAQLGGGVGGGQAGGRPGGGQSGGAAVSGGQSGGTSVGGGQSGGAAVSGGQSGGTSVGGGQSGGTPVGGGQSGGTAVSGGQSGGQVAGGVSGGQGSTSDFMVVLVGTGSAPLTPAATPVFVQRRSITTGAVITSIPMPTAASGANQALTLSGVATTEGSLSLSPDGRTLALFGYSSPAGTASVRDTTTPRVVGLITANDLVTRSANTSTTLGTALSQRTPRSAILSGSNIWACGEAEGVLLTSVGATSAPTVISPDPANCRTLSISGGLLWVGSAATQVGIFRVGMSGLPTTPATVVPEIRLPLGPTSFAFLDIFSGEPGVDLAYVATGQNGLVRLYKVFNWVTQTTFTPEAYFISCLPTQAGDVICLVTSPTTVYGLFDEMANAPARALTPLATAPPNTAFRGVAFVPLP